jgi:bifunctional non-homologous end joining protein LigD
VSGAWRSAKQAGCGCCRTRQSLNDTYPELVGALDSQSSEFIVDGEIVAFQGRHTSFERLQERIQLRDPVSALRSGVAVFYYLFDLLYLDGYDTTALQLRDRKGLLRSGLSYGGPLRFLSHRNTEGEALYREACRRG